jgi:hypothetical protein
MTHLADQPVNYSGHLAGCILQTVRRYNQILWMVD